MPDSDPLADSRPSPKWFLRRMLMINIYKGDADAVRNWIAEGADPNWRTPKGRPALLKAVRGPIVEASVVKALLDNGADAAATDIDGLTALDCARRRLVKYEGKPRQPIRRSPSLTPGGELRLQPHEWTRIERMEQEFPGFQEMYLEQRRKAAERVFDTRGNLERILPLLENHRPGPKP